MMPYPFWGKPQNPFGVHQTSTQQTTQSSKPRKVEKPPTRVSNRCLETKSYPDFKFNHMFSMLVVGPSQCGKTYFVEKVFTENCIQFPDNKPQQIIWLYNQWQKRYEQLQRRLGDRIVFEQGIPELSEDLSEISLSRHRIFVFDDLMAQATDSPVLSKLFTQCWGDIAMRVSFYCCKICFLKKNSIQILVETHSIWSCLKAPVIESKLTLSLNGFLPKIDPILCLCMDM